MVFILNDNDDDVDDENYEFILDSGEFPTKYRAHRSRAPNEFRIPTESSLYPYLLKSMRNNEEYLFIDVSMNLSSFPGRTQTQTTLMAKAFGSRIFVIIVPESVPPEKFNHQNYINIGGLERESLGGYQ